MCSHFCSLFSSTATKCQRLIRLLSRLSIISRWDQTRSLQTQESTSSGRCVDDKIIQAARCGAWVLWSTPGALPRSTLRPSWWKWRKVHAVASFGRLPKPHTATEIDLRLCELVEHAWEEGDSRKIPADARSGLLHFIGALRGQLSGSQRLLRAWSKN